MSWLWTCRSTLTLNKTGNYWVGSKTIDRTRLALLITRHVRRD